jgi:prepilin-type N-terminal cleavage/methylation domain-containing protein
MHVKRSGFSLIELVLSIVVIAIALMTVPLMLGQGAKSNQYALVQESILAARTKMGNILSFKWDENASTTATSIVRVVDVVQGDAQLDRNTSNRRIGHTKEDLRRRMTDVETNASLGQEVVGIFDDIDDFDGESTSVSPVGAAGVKGEYDYLDEDLNLTTIVRYISDDANYSQQTFTFDFNVSSAANFSDINSTNIKMVELRATSINRDFPFVFRIFSSNIGQSKLIERVK